MPGIGSSAYVTMESLANLIRAINNDMIFSQAGEILTDASNYMFPLANDALEWFENEVNNHGIDTFTKETWLLNVLATPAPTDPGIQVQIGDTGYFDGVGNHAGPQAPPDMYEPLFIWERQTGSNEEWQPMTQRLDGLPSSSGRSLRLRVWEWREDQITMPGATQSNDLRLRYTGTHAMFATINDTLYFRGAVGPIAYKMVSTFLLTKNPEGSKMALAEAQLRLAQIATRDSRTKQRDTITRISYGMPRGARRFTPPRNP
jgi:hypothetical protein